MSVTLEDVLVFLDAVEEFGYGDVQITQVNRLGQFSLMYPQKFLWNPSGNFFSIKEYWTRDIISFERINQRRQLLTADCWLLAGLGCPLAREMALKLEQEK